MRNNPFFLTLLATLALTDMHQVFPLGFGVSVSPNPSTNFIQGTGAPSSVNFDPNAYYRFTTMWQGECKSLDIIDDGRNDRPILVKTGHFSGQYWKITAAGNGYIRLTTLRQGMDKSLDIINDGKNDQPALAKTGNFSGQLWQITAVGDGYFRLTTQWQGSGKSLDIVSDGNNNQAILAKTGNSSGQYWKISRAEFISAPPASLHLNPFYKKYLDADGIPIISSDKVPDAALYQARFMALHMLSKTPLVLAEMVKHGARVAVMAKTEVTTDIPEHEFLKDDRKTDWNKRARGLGSTVEIPTSSCAEENVLCYQDDTYKGEDIFIHEFAHSIHKLGLVFSFPDFQKQLEAAYSNAKSKGLWLKTYAVTNPDEYFAEGVQDWFNVNLESDPPNGIHNQINTRQELKAYDPMLYNLLKKYFPEDENKCSCQ